MNDMKGKTCCFTGHRNLPLDEIPALRVRLGKMIEDCIKEGYLYFGAGGALGFDTLAAQTVLALKGKYPHVKLILVLPCPEQTRGWNSTDIKEYEQIKTKADKVVYTSDKYGRGCMHKRNRHLVDYSSLCICHMTKETGGTAYTVAYAKAKGVKVISI